MYFIVIMYFTDNSARLAYLIIFYHTVRHLVFRDLYTGHKYSFCGLRTKNIYCVKIVFLFETQIQIILLQYIALKLFFSSKYKSKLFHFNIYRVKLFFSSTYEYSFTSNFLIIIILPEFYVLSIFSQNFGQAHVAVKLSLTIFAIR